jgi:hypothetical protein
MKNKTQDNLNRSQTNSNLEITKPNKTLKPN